MKGTFQTLEQCPTSASDYAMYCFCTAAGVTFMICALLSLDRLLRVPYINRLALDSHPWVILIISVAKCFSKTIYILPNGVEMSVREYAEQQSSGEIVNCQPTNSTIISFDLTSLDSYIGH